MLQRGRRSRRCGSADLRVTRSVAAGGSDGDSGVDDLAPAEQARLLAVDLSAQKLVFRHPLICAAVVAVATAVSAGPRIACSRSCSPPTRTSAHGT